MKLYFENKTGTEGRLNLNDKSIQNTLKPSFSRFKRRSKFEPRFSKNGSVAVGDNAIESRQIDFVFQLTSGSDGNAQELDENYRNELSKYIEFFNPINSPFYLVDTDAKLGNGLRTELHFIDVDENPEDETSMRVANISMSFEMLDGTWEDLNTVSTEDPLISNTDTFDLDNDGNIETYPVFIFTSLENMQDLTIRNLTNGQFFTYSNTSFGAGSVLRVDGSGKEFVVELNGIDTAYALTEGSGPINLDPGVNNFEYLADGDCSYTIEYRPRYTN
jgi:hypothetical protein